MVTRAVRRLLRHPLGLVGLTLLNGLVFALHLHLYQSRFSCSSQSLKAWLVVKETFG